MTDRVSPPLDSATVKVCSAGRWWGWVGPHCQPGVSTSTVPVPIMEPHRLRTPLGTAFLLLRSAKPIILSRTPWIDRRDGNDLKASRTELEEVMMRAYAEAG